MIKTLPLFNKFAKNVLKKEISTTPYKTAKEAILELYHAIESSGLPITFPEVGITDNHLFVQMANESERMLGNSFTPLNSSDVVQILENSMSPNITFRV